MVQSERITYTYERCGSSFVHTEAPLHVDLIVSIEFADDTKVGDIAGRCVVSVKSAILSENRCSRAERSGQQKEILPLNIAAGIQHGY